MFALGGGKARKAVDGPGSFADGRTFVLPRPMRRAMRFTQALATGRIDMPRHVGLISAAVLIGATATYGMVLGGHTHATMETASSAFGFAVDKVNITGNAETSDIDILQQLHLDGDTSLLTMNVHAARQALLQLPWVADADIRKVYPDAVDIAIRERKAFAIWQHGQDLSLIEKSGNVISPFVQGSKFSALPLYVGLGAETEAADFNRMLAHWPALQTRVKAVVRVADRRWNLTFDNGVVVRLPEEHVAQAIENLSVMVSQRQILSHNIAAVDLRLADRITVQLTPQAAEQRQADLKARDKALKRAEKVAWKKEDKPV